MLKTSISGIICVFVSIILAFDAQAESKVSKFNIVIAENASEAEKMAANELSYYLGRILGKDKTPVISETESQKDGFTFLIGETQKGEKLLQEKSIPLDPKGEDSFVMLKTDDALVLKGNRPRSTFYAIYAFLEKQGYVFIEPGKDNELIPKRESLNLDIPLKVETAALPFRNVNLDLGRWQGVERQIDIIDWALKNRANIAEIIPWHEPSCHIIECWQELVKEAKKRDMLVSAGGHGFGMFLILPPKYMSPENQFKNWKEFMAAVNETKKSEPELFGDATKPISRTSGAKLFCMANKASRDRYISNLMLFLEKHPEIDMVRFGQNDCGATCNCAKCKENRLAHYFGDLLPRIGAEMEKRFPGKLYIHTLQGKGNFWNVDKAKEFKNIPLNIVFSITNESFDFRGNIGAKYNKARHAQYPRQKKAFPKHSFVTKEMYGSGLYRKVPIWAPEIVTENTKFYHEKYPKNYIGTWYFINGHDSWRVWEPNLLTCLRSLWDTDFDQKSFWEEARKRAYPACEDLGKEIFNLNNGPSIEVAILTGQLCAWGRSESPKPFPETLAMVKNYIKTAESIQKKIVEKTASSKNKFLITRLKTDSKTIGIGLSQAKKLLKIMEEFKNSPESKAEHWPQKIKDKIKERKRASKKK